MKHNLSEVKRVSVLKVRWNTDLNAEGSYAPSATLAAMALKLASAEADFFNVLGVFFESI